MSKYKEKSIQELWILLAFLEQNISVLQKFQDKIKYQVEKGILTDSEVAPLVEQSREAFIAIDTETIEIEKAMDLKVRKRTGIRHLSTSLVRMDKELQALINSRLKEKQDAEKDPSVRSINYDA